AVVEEDLFSQSKSEIILKEQPVGLDIDCEAIEVVKPPDVDAARRKSLSLVFQGGLELLRGRVPFGLIIKLDLMPVRVLAYEGLALSETAIGPAHIKSRASKGRSPPFERLRAARAKRHVPHP